MKYAMDPIDLNGWEKTLKNAEKAKNYQEASRLIIQIGTFHENNHNYDIAMNLFTRGLRYAEKARFPVGQALNLMHMGLIHHIQKDPLGAIKYYEKALKVYEDAGDQQGVGSCLNNIGLMYESLGKFDKALNIFYGFASVGQTYHKQVVELYNKNYGQIGDLLKALSIAESVQKYDEVISILFKIGSIYLERMQIATAIEYYQKALKIATMTEDKKLRATSLNQIGSFYRFIRDYNLSLKIYHDALDQYKKSNDSIGIANCLVNIGIINKLIKDFPEAIRNFKEALEILEQNNEPSSIMVRTELNYVETQNRKNKSNSDNSSNSFSIFDLATMAGINRMDVNAFLARCSVDERGRPYRQCRRCGELFIGNRCEKCGWQLT
jgi:tetratricopeptide (TPR) repeat protein